MNTCTYPTSVRLTVASVFAIVVAGLLTTDASAETRSDTVKKVTVNFAELNLDKPAGVEILYKRLRNASASVCGGRQAIQAYRSAKRCYEAALSQAVNDVNKPLLSQLHGVELERLAGRK
jgi:UrcA family protein